MSLNSWLDSYSLKETRSTYILNGYRVLFSDKLAREYEPIVYSSECMSGDPEAVYYRIVQNNKHEFCIQYFYYWVYQNCLVPHKYDYEPILIYVRPNNPDPYLIVNGGFGQASCNFHKNEVRPRKGIRDSTSHHVTVNLSPYPFYPFGKDGTVRYRGCIKTYPLSGNDLKFEGNSPLFGIRICSNVFSGAQGDLHGSIFRPRLKKLTDRVLTRWYLHHYKSKDDMPFGHDIADPFSSPYIKFHKPTKAEISRLRRKTTIE